MKNISAFPIPHLIADANDDNFKLGQSGMTLRDYFAGEAVSSIMTAFINNPEKDALVQGAELAYMLADAMMKAREQ
jgi:hypothetical protein